MTYILATRHTAHISSSGELPLRGAREATYSQRIYQTNMFFRTDSGLILLRDVLDTSGTLERLCLSRVNYSQGSDTRKWVACRREERTKRLDYYFSGPTHTFSQGAKIPSGEIHTTMRFCRLRQTSFCQAFFVGLVVA